MIHLVLADTVLRKSSQYRATRWCYIGKDFSAREKVAAVCGEHQRYFLGNRLHGIVGKVRDAFQNYVGAMGAGLPDQLSWWASRFASRSPLQSDFFLLCCYRILVHNLIDHAPKDSKLLVVVEDPWLYRQLQGDLARSGHPGVSFDGEVNLGRYRFRLLARGVVYRFLLLGYLSLQKYLTRIFYGATAPVKGTRSRSVALLALIDQRSLNRKSGEFKETYTGDLGSFLESKHIHVIYPTYLRFPLQFVRAVAKNRDVLWPLVFDLSLPRAFLCALRVWRVNPFPLPEAMGGSPVDHLLKREFWKEFSASSFNENLMYYHAIKSFLSRDWVAVFHYPFENQPFEKMLCMAARGFARVRLIGYRDSMTSADQLNMFLGKGEREYVPLPHKIITIGELSQKLFVEHGRYPEGLIVNGGAWRYVRWASAPEQSTGNIAKNVVLVATPIDKSLSKALILDVIRAFQGHDNSLKFLIKCHPAAPFESLGIRAELGSSFEVTERPVDKLIEEIDTIIYSASTVGVEFFVKGKKVIRYILENQIDLDPLGGAPSHLYYKCSEGACREAIENAVREELDPEKVEKMREMRSAFFGPVHHGVWLEEFDTGNGRN